MPEYKYWLGSNCTTQAGYPDGVHLISDIITINKDSGKQIPASSFMLYLFEFFDKHKSTPIELNLICQSDGQDYFEAIFNGINQYRFKRILPVVGHSYAREIIAKPQEQVIEYNLTAISPGQPTESVVLGENSMNGSVDQATKEFLIKKLKKLRFEAEGHVTCIEWHNKTDNSPSPFPIRYQAEISLLQYDINPAHKSPLPYTSLTPHKDDEGQNYPVMFRDIGLKKNCICYTVDNGNSQNGMTYSMS
jgi:hypothetical protein